MDGGKSYHVERCHPETHPTALLALDEIWGERGGEGGDDPWGRGAEEMAVGGPLPAPPTSRREGADPHSPAKACREPRPLGSPSAAGGWARPRPAPALLLEVRGSEGGERPRRWPGSGHQPHGAAAPPPPPLRSAPRPPSGKGKESALPPA